MLKETISKLLNEQINHEMYSSYLYLSMAAYFEASSLPGFATWMRIQSAEEMEHAMKFFDYVNDRGGRVKLAAINAPKFEWTSVVEVFEETLAHEQKVTNLINAIYEKAVEEKDYPTQSMLLWFINEQVEEEKNATLLLDQLKMSEERKGTLINIDRHVGKRGKED